MKKLLSLLLALAMVLALSVCALASGEAPAEASGEVAVEVTNEGFGSYVAYLRQYIADCDDPQFDDGAKEMALGELDTVEIGADVHAFPFDMFVEIWGAQTYEEFMTSGQDAALLEPQSEEEFNAYKDYLKEYIMTVDIAAVNPDFVEDGRDMMISELDGVGFGSDVYAFPFEMVINELKAPTFDEFMKASDEPSGEASGDVSGYDAYVAYLEEYIRENIEADYVDMALGDLYAATEAQAAAEEFPFEMFTSAHGAMSYAQWQAANG